MLPLKDKLRAIIHQLRMETLLNADSSSIIDLRSRILKLPSPEIINKMSREDLESLQKRLERLAFDIDKASNIRSQERALVDISRKGIPSFRAPLLATKFTFKCPTCKRVYHNGQWVGEINDDDFCIEKHCPSCQNRNTKKSFNNWYSISQKN